MQHEVLILTTGGTIDKVYFDAKSSYSVGDPQIGDVLREAHVTLPHRIVSLMRKDSLDLTDEDRDLIRKFIQTHEHSLVLVTHGTDTMTRTAEALKGIPGKTIVLTGALMPARFKDNDAIFNIGFALGALQALPEGVHIAIGGCIYDPCKVRKDRQMNRFIEIPDGEDQGRD